jgi:hypothetical protein
MSTVPGRAASRKPDAVSEITARRNKLLGLWATERMGMMGDVAAEYVLGLLEIGQRSDDQSLVRKVCKDMRDRGYPISSRDVKRQLEECAADARSSLTGGATSSSDAGT